MDNLFSDVLFQELTNDKNIYLAYLQSIKGRRFRPDVLNFSYILEQELVAIKNALISYGYIPGSYFSFVINDSKKRIIWAAPFKDRIVHHSLCNILEPIFERSFIFDNYACRLGKGGSRAILRLRHFLKVVGGGNRRKNLLFEMWYLQILW